MNQPKNIVDSTVENFNAIFDARVSPKAAALFGRKYILPQVRQGEYFDQSKINTLALAQITLCASEKRIANSHADLLPLFLGTHYNRPTLFLERELGEILLKSKLPEDMALDDIMQQFPTTRIMLPKGLLEIKHSDFTESIMFIDISFVKRWERSACKEDIAIELDAQVAHMLGKDSNRPSVRDLKLSRMRDELPGICINGTSNVRGVSYGITKSWDWGTLKGILNSDNHLNESAIPAMDDEGMELKIEHLGFNILILLSAVPAEYEPDRVIRKAKAEGKRIIPALLQPKWIGDHLVRARKAGMVKGEISSNSTERKIPGHWVTPHWRRQPYGKGFSLRKLIWILPYQTGTNEKETN